MMTGAAATPQPVPAAIVLASGMSIRFPGSNKLLVSVGGIPLVRRVVAAYVQVAFSTILVVVGFEGQRVESALAGLPVTAIANPDYAMGQSRSLVRGISALPAGTPAALIGVADQPFLTAGVIRSIVDRYRRSNARLVVPRFAGQRGNPALFRADLFPELLAVEGDRGGRPVIVRHATEIEWVDFDDSRIGVDIDTWEEYEAGQARTGLVS